MLDRNTLLEEFLRFFHFYYQHNQQENGDNQVGSPSGESKVRLSQISNINYDSVEDFNVAEAMNFSNASNYSLKQPISSASTGHNKNNNYSKNKYSIRATDEDYYGDY